MPLIKRNQNAVPQEAVPQYVALPSLEQAVENTVLKSPMPVHTRRITSSDTMSKEDWANKDKRISLQGLLQALLGSVNFGQYCTGTTADEYLTAVEHASLRLAKFVAENGK